MVATATGLTAEHMQELVDENIVGGHVSGDDLILDKRGGGSVNAGNVRGATGAPGAAGAPGSVTLRWAWGTAYTTGQVVGYSGRYYKALSNNTSKPPAMFGSIWQCITGSQFDFPVVSDPYFESDDAASHWEGFWGTGTHSFSMTSTAGEFETGKRGGKIVLGTSATQWIYPKDETIFRDGEYVQIRVRAKVLSGTGVTLTGGATINDDSGNAEPFGGGGVVTIGQIEAAQALTTSWTSYWLTIGPMSAGKPRATIDIVFSTGAGSGATVLIDRVKIFRRDGLFTCDTDWINISAFANSWVAFDANRIPQYRREGGVVKHRGLIKSGTLSSTSQAFTNPAGFRIANRNGTGNEEFYPIITNSLAGAATVFADGKVAIIGTSNVWADISGIRYDAAA